MTSIAARLNQIRFPDKYKAHTEVIKAVARGDLVRPSQCSHCGEQGKIAAHHADGYDQPHWLVVVWLCGPCHWRAHNPNGWQPPITLVPTPEEMLILANPRPRGRPRKLGSVG